MAFTHARVELRGTSKPDFLANFLHKSISPCLWNGKKGLKDTLRAFIITCWHAFIDSLSTLCGENNCWRLWVAVADSCEEHKKRKSVGLRLMTIAWYSDWTFLCWERRWTLYLDMRNHFFAAFFVSLNKSISSFKYASLPASWLTWPWKSDLTVVHKLCDSKLIIINCRNQTCLQTIVDSSELAF